MVQVTISNAAVRGYRVVEAIENDRLVYKQDVKVSCVERVANAIRDEYYRGSCFLCGSNIGMEPIDNPYKSKLDKREHVMICAECAAIRKRLGHKS